MASEGVVTLCCRRHGSLITGIQSDRYKLAPFESGQTILDGKRLLLIAQIMSENTSSKKFGEW